MSETVREPAQSPVTANGLREYPWEVSYSTSDIRRDGHAIDILHDFYLPVLERATHYDRVAGYFSSTSLAAASRGFSRFVGNRGKARFIVGTDLSVDDAEAILRGDAARAERRLMAALEGENEWSVEVRRGVGLLAWMVAHGHLDVRVAIRVHGGDGSARPMDYQGDGYVHEKWAIFDDGVDALVASGSLNESRTALVINAENLEIFTSWEGKGQERIRRKRESFDAMWKGEHPFIRTFDLPSAVQQRLVAIASRAEPLEELDGTPAEADAHVAPDRQLTGRERLQFALIRLAPLLPGGELVGMETTPIAPWPHQRFVARRIVQEYPDNLLLCDEVGLGKTIEAGLAFRSLWLAGRVNSIRVFAPASLTSQWLHEMAEKFLMPFRRGPVRNGVFERVNPATGETSNETGAPFDYPLEIISTGLIVHRGARFLDTMGDTDLVLLDEAHKARRSHSHHKQLEPSANKLYRALDQAIFPKSQALLLATATPMQLTPLEAFDLLRFMPAAGAVRLLAGLCDLFYSLRETVTDHDSLADHQLRFLARYLADVKRTAPAQWQFVFNEVLGDLITQEDMNLLVNHCMAPSSWEPLQPALSMLSPLGRTMVRHTRTLLREYQRAGLLTQNLAFRHVESEIVALEGEEKALYERLQAYCEELAQRVTANSRGGRQRIAIGFYLSFLRQRFASSFKALTLSLERRLEKIQLTLHHQTARLFEPSDEDEVDELNEDELIGLVLRNRETADLTWEQGAVSALLRAMQQFTVTPRKTVKLLELVQQRRTGSSGRVEQMVVFTRFTDTMHYLYDELTRRLPECPIGTFSGEGGSLRRPRQGQPEGLDRMAVRRQFVEGAIDILLCTDAAAEGLNLQSANLLLNFDLPWNPMLLEQRIGRIDRIGQKHKRISVVNFVYQGSVEEHVYVRLVARFRSAVNVSGELQFSLLPIEEQDFRDYSKTPSEEGRIDWNELQRRATEHRQRIVERQRLTEFPPKAQKAAYEHLEQADNIGRTPVTIDNIWEALSTSETLTGMGCRVEAFEHGSALALSGLETIPDDTLLTTSRDLYDHGLPKGDLRSLHFATYGDPVFERLLDELLHTEELVLKASQERKPLESITIGSGCCVQCFSDIEALTSVSSETLEPTPRIYQPEPPTDNRRSGLLHLQLVASAAAFLANAKLRQHTETPAAQLAHVDTFARDVDMRSDQAFQVPINVSNRTDFLAFREHLLWPIESDGGNIRLNGDPLLLNLCRDLIERALRSVKPERRTGPLIAERMQNWARSQSE